MLTWGPNTCVGEKTLKTDVLQFWGGRCLLFEGLLFVVLSVMVIV